MAQFISKEGKWQPAMEKVGLTNDTDKTIVVNGKEVPPGDPYIYEGPCRDAKRIMDENDGALGQDFRYDSDFLQRVRNLGFAKTEDYIALFKGDIEKAKANLEKEEKKISRHEAPPKSKDDVSSPGGTDTSSGKEVRKGGYGDVPSGDM